MKLADVVTLERGTTYQSALLGKAGPILLGLATIDRNGGFRADSLRTYGGDSPDKLLVQPGQLYASLKDVTQTADLLGAVARVPLNSPPGRLTQDTVRLDFKDREVRPSYLYWMLRTPRYREYCRGCATGTTTMGLPREDFLAFDLPDPNLARETLVDLLDALDEKIALNDRGITLADQLAEALTKKALSVEAVPLKALADVTMGSSPPGESYNEVGDGMPFYQGVRDFGFRFPRKRVWTTSPVRMAKAQDTLLSVRAPVGRTNIAKESVCLGRGVAALHSRVGRSLALFHQIRAAEAAWAPYESEGTVFGAVNRGNLERVLVPAVREEAADLLERELVVLESWIAAALDENEQLAATRDELLPLLMSEKLRVKDAEKFVEVVL